MNRLTDANYRLNAVDCQARTLMRWAPTGIGARGFFTSHRRTMVRIALTLWISCALIESRLAAAQDVPSGTIELSGGSLAAGVGYTWGSGTLIFEGKEYPLKVNGISLIHAGVHTYTGSGTVYHLTKLSDFNGVYTAVSPRSSIVEGASTIAMKTPHGVLIQMAATHAGFAFSLGPNGATIELK